VSPQPWWRHHFDDAYFALHDPLFTETASRQEVAGMVELLGLAQGAHVLDAPCGWGRHAGLLAEAGCEVFGADLSWDLLRRAPRAADSAEGSANSAEAPTNTAEIRAADSDDVPADRPLYAASDIRALPFADGSFDAVINVFTSLGLFLDDAEDVAALGEAHRVLRPGGALLLESMHRGDVVGY
jgi:SAM-dependent methyltransferase